MISLLQGIFIFLILFFMVKRFKIGLAFYLAYIMLIPYMNINIGGVTLQWNLINLIVLILSFYEFGKKKNYKIDYKPLIPFFIYFGISLVMMLFQNYMPISVELDMWRAQVMKFLILPFAIWNEMRIDKSSVKLYRNVTFFCIIVAAVYGLFLTSIPGLNPYIMLLSNINGEEFNRDYALAFGEGRIFGRISSVFTHPMTFGVFLGFSFIYVFYNRRYLNKYLFLMLFAIIGIDILVCGVRSVIGGIAIAIVFYFLQARNYKLMLLAAVIGFIGYWVIINMPDLSVYLKSIADVNNKKQYVTGSSIDMRIEQFYGCLKEIQDCIFTGKGFGWTGYYKSIYGDHPVMLSFESLIYVVLCNSGIIGVLLWICMCTKISKYNSQKVDSYVLLNTLLVFYIGYSCITGEYGYMQFFIIFYVLMLGETLICNAELKNKSI